MNELIASFLVQNGSCRLAGIGRFELQTTSAVSDVASKVIYPPEANYAFSEGSGQTSEALIAYIAFKTHIDTAAAETRISNWLTGTIRQLKDHDTINLPAIGKLVKNDEDIIVFMPSNTPVSMQPAPADRVIHENDTHKVLVGDVESDSEKMNLLLHPETGSATKKWWKAALVILIITVFLYLAFLILGKPGIGINAQDAPATYISR